MRYRLTDAHARLLRGLRAILAADAVLGPLLRHEQGVWLVIEDFDSEPWASLTFAGTRHRMELRLRGNQARVHRAHRRLEALLAEPDVDLPGLFLVEMMLVAGEEEILRDGHVGLAIRIEALTIEE
jgi:hypothetical protein